MSDSQTSGSCYIWTSYFLWIKKHTTQPVNSNSQTNKSYGLVLFSESKHTAQEVNYDSQTNESYGLVLLSESKHTSNQCILVHE